MSQHRSSLYQDLAWKTKKGCNVNVWRTARIKGLTFYKEKSDLLRHEKSDLLQGQGTALNRCMPMLVQRDHEKTVPTNGSWSSWP